MRRAEWTGVLLSAGLLGTACGGEAVAPAGGEATSRLEFALSGFEGRSVRITGTRAAAEPKYACASGFTSCLAFDPDGVVSVEGLCASSDVPSSPWSFAYEVYSDASCGDDGGVQLNRTDSPDQFTCWDSQDLLTRAHPNASVGENLVPGVNHDDVVCTHLTFAWQAGPFGPCSAGFQTRTVTCVDSTGAAVADGFCDPATKPSTSQPCPPG